MVLLYGYIFYIAILARVIIMKQLNDNIKRLMTRNSIDDITLAKETGIPLTTISRLKNASNINPTIKSLEPIATYFGVSVSDLIGDQPLKQNTQQKLLPIIPMNDAGKWSQEIGSNFGVNVTTSTYEPRIPINSIVILKNDAPSEDDIVLVQFTNDPKPIFKRYIMEGSSPLLKSMVAGDNRTTTLKLDDQILGIICEIRFAFKTSTYKKPASTLLKNELPNYSGEIYALIPT